MHHSGCQTTCLTANLVTHPQQHKALQPVTNLRGANLETLKLGTVDRFSKHLATLLLEQ